MSDDDARFEDGTEHPLRLRAETPDDLKVISALLQDAVTQAGDTAWMARRHRFTLLLNRFRWEDVPQAERQGRKFERVRCLLTIESALRVRANGIDPKARDLVLSLLSLSFTPGEDTSGRLLLTFSGDGEIALEVECIDVSLTDVTRPHVAQSDHPPRHPVD